MSAPPTRGRDARCSVCGSPRDVQLEDGHRLCATCRARCAAVVAGTIGRHATARRARHAESKGPICRTPGCTERAGVSMKGKNRRYCLRCRRERKARFQREWRQAHRRERGAA